MRMRPVCVLSNITKSILYIIPFGNKQYSTGKYNIIPKTLRTSQSCTNLIDKNRTNEITLKKNYNSILLKQITNSYLHFYKSIIDLTFVLIRRLPIGFQTNSILTSRVASSVVYARIKLRFSSFTE